MDKEQFDDLEKCSLRVIFLHILDGRSSFVLTESEKNMTQNNELGTE